MLYEVSNTPKSIQSPIDYRISKIDTLIDQSLRKHSHTKISDQGKEHINTVIIDEADRLQAKGLEQIRDLYDRRAITIILVGMPGIEKRLVRYPQLYSRIGFVHHYKQLGKEEITFILQKRLQSFNVQISLDDFSDQQAIALFTQITRGNFRLIQRMLKQMVRIMEINQLSSVTKEVIASARECLVIGNVD